MRLSLAWRYNISWLAISPSDTEDNYDEATIHYRLKVALIVCGFFLFFHGSLICLYFRLRAEIKVMRESNEKFERNIDNLETKVSKLRKARDALGHIAKQYDGDCAKAVADSEKLKALTRTSLGNSCRTLCKLYTDKDGDRLIDAGDEMQTMLDLLGSLFLRLVPDWPDRMACAKAIIVAHERFHHHGGLKQNTFADIVHCALEAEVTHVGHRVREIMDAVPLA